jgi:hypothetical protein
MVKCKLNRSEAQRGIGQYACPTMRSNSKLLKPSKRAGGNFGIRKKVARAFQNPNFKMCRAASARPYTQRSILCRRQDSSIMSVSGSILVAASLLDSCLALTQSRPNLRTSCSLTHLHDRHKCMRLSGGGGGERLHGEVKHQASNAIHCLFRIKVPHTMPGDTVKIAGGAESMGNWQKHRALNLTTSKHDFPWFAPSVALV